MPKPKKPMSIYDTGESVEDTMYSNAPKNLSPAAMAMVIRRKQAPLADQQQRALLRQDSEYSKPEYEDRKAYIRNHMENERLRFNPTMESWIKKKNKVRV